MTHDASALSPAHAHHSVTEMRLPVRARDAVVDQRIRGGGVGDTQQCLRETQQGDAFARAKVVLLQEIGDVGTGGVRGAGGADQGTGPLGYARGERWG